MNWSIWKKVLFWSIIILVTGLNVYVLETTLSHNNQSTVIRQQEKTIQELQNALKIKVKEYQDLQKKQDDILEQIKAIHEYFTSVGKKIEFPLCRTKIDMTSRFGSRWGAFHAGIDLAGRTGDKVKAASSGRIIASGWKGGYGNMIEIDHGSFITVYGHLSKILLFKNAWVKQGTIIGLVGNTGRSYGSHLHFEIRRKLKNGKEVFFNPIYFI